MSLRWTNGLFLLAGLGAASWWWLHYPFPLPGDNAALDLVRLSTPGVAAVLHGWWYAAPGVAVFGIGQVGLAVWRVWGVRRARRRSAGTLPPWPVSPLDPEPAVVVGELHHPVDVREQPHPAWLTIPARGLYTGVAVFGAVGSGKTSACMRPFAQQLFSWQADDPGRRAAGLILEVKGNFCEQVREILEAAGRGGDYCEIGLESPWSWNPLASPWLDAYSLAYTIAALLHQLFGKGKEPFWQTASTNVIRWIIELHRMQPGSSCVTLRDVYRCAIDPELFDARIAAAAAAAEAGGNDPAWIVVGSTDIARHATTLQAWSWERVPDESGQARAAFDAALAAHLAQLDVDFTIDRTPAAEAWQARVEAVRRWYEKDWLALDPKLRTSIVEGISAFLSLFDVPEVAAAFCAPSPVVADVASGTAFDAQRVAVRRPLPSLDDLVEHGKVLALNMPAGANPALARAIGVLLKNAWLQTVLQRPARMKQQPNRHVRPAVFLCDEYQSFATVGEDDPSGDEKSFALTRECRVIPVVATQSISSLRSVLAGDAAWRTLLQTLRTRIFLTLSDEASTEMAARMCGQVPRMKASYSMSEQTSRAQVSWISGRAGGGTGGIGASKSWREQREPLFHPRAFALLDNYQAIVLPYDGTRARAATRVYLKPHYLPRMRPYWRAREAGEL